MTKKRFNSLIALTDISKIRQMDDKTEKIGHLMSRLSILASDLRYLYNAQFVAWEFKTCFSPDEVAHQVATELSRELSDNVFCYRHGDNGDDDVGYELVWWNGGFSCDNGKRNVFDIAVVTKDKTRRVVADTGEGDIPLSDIDDLINLLQSFSQSKEELR